MTKPDCLPKGWSVLKIDGFMTLIGPFLRSKDQDDATIYGLQTTAHHKNHLGIVHGGVLTALLDQAIAITAWNAVDRQPTVTVQMDTRFMGAVKAGDFLEIHPVVDHVTRSLVFVSAQVVCNDVVIARASAVMKVSKQVEQKS